MQMGPHELSNPHPHCAPLAWLRPPVSPVSVQAATAQGCWPDERPGARCQAMPDADRFFFTSKHGKGMELFELPHPAIPCRQGRHAATSRPSTLASGNAQRHRHGQRLKNGSAAAVMMWWGANAMSQEKADILAWLSSQQPGVHHAHSHVFARPHAGSDRCCLSCLGGTAVADGGGRFAT